MSVIQHFAAAIVLPSKYTGRRVAAAGPPRPYPEQALTATINEWADPTLQHAVIALQPYGWMPSVIYHIADDGSTDNIYQVEGHERWLMHDDLRCYSIWDYVRPIVPTHYSYDLLHCYLAGITWDAIIFAPPTIECEWFREPVAVNAGRGGATGP